MQQEDVHLLTSFPGRPADYLAQTGLVPLSHSAVEVKSSLLLQTLAYYNLHKHILLTVYMEHWMVIWIFQVIFYYFFVRSLSSCDTRSYMEDFYLNINLCPLVNAQTILHSKTLGEAGWNPGSTGSMGNGPGWAGAEEEGQDTISSLSQLAGGHCCSLEAFQNHDLPLPK